MYVTAVADEELDFYNWFSTTPSDTYTLGNNPYYNFTVDWGDGTPLESYNSSTLADCKHIYTTAGNYEIVFMGRIDYLNESDDASSFYKRITQIEVIDECPVRYIYRPFYRFSNLTHIAKEFFKNILTTEYWKLAQGAGKLKWDDDNFSLATRLESFASEPMYGNSFTALGNGIFKNTKLCKTNDLFYHFTNSHIGFVFDGLDENATYSFTNLFTECLSTTVEPTLFNKIKGPKNINQIMQSWGADLRNLKSFGLNMYNSTYTSLFYGISRNSALVDISLYNLPTSEDLDKFILNSKLPDRSAKNTRGVIRILKSDEHPEYANSITTATEEQISKVNVQGWDITYSADNTTPVDSTMYIDITVPANQQINLASYFSTTKFNNLEVVYDFTVNWGELTPQPLSTYTNSNLSSCTHTYSAAGNYTITLKGKIYQIVGKTETLASTDIQKFITNVRIVGNNPVRAIQYPFAQCNMTSYGEQLIKASYIPSLSYFYKNSKLGDGNIPEGLFDNLIYNTITDINEGFRNANVKSVPETLLSTLTSLSNVSYIFADNSDLVECPLFLFNYSTNVTDLSYAFRNCTSLTKCGINLWAATDLTGIFNGCNNLKDVCVCNAKSSEIIDSLIALLPVRRNNDGTLYLQRTSEKADYAAAIAKATEEQFALAMAKGWSISYTITNTPLKYVSSQLVAGYDGIANGPNLEHLNNTPIWYDYSGNENHTILNSNFTAPAWAIDGIDWSGQISTAGIEFPAAVSSTTPNVWSFQIVAIVPDTHRRGFVLYKNTIGFMIANGIYYNDNDKCGIGCNSGWLFYMPGEMGRLITYTFVMDRNNVGRCYADNNLYLDGSSRKLYISETGNWKMNKAKVLNQFTNGIDANVKAIRFYNRALTPTEIAYNVNIDKERFNL